MQTIWNDLKVAGGLFIDMRKARKRGSEIRLEKKVELPFIQTGGFYNTVEGCTLDRLDREITHKAEEAFCSLSEEEKYKMQFSPKNGEFVERARFWRNTLSPFMTEKQCYIAMHCIIHWYIHIKQMRF